MSKLALNISRDFSQKVSFLETVRVKMETLFSSNSILNHDIEQVYSGLFLEAFTSFENSIELLFLGLLDGSIHSRARPVTKLIKIQPALHVRNIVFNFRAYLDWLPIDEKTIPLAKKYFHNGEPFSLLNPTQVANLKFYHYIRNAIAHKSNAAQTNFARVIAGKPLLPQEKTPTGYLRSVPSATSAQTQFQIAITELESILNTLCL